MAVGFGRRWRQQLMDWTFGKGSPSTPAGVVWLSLHTTNPGDDGQGGGEATGTGYARVACTAATWAAATLPANDAASITDNAALIQFPVSGGAWSAGANLTHLGMWISSTLSTEANFVGRLALATPQAVTATNQQITIAIGSLDWTGIST